MYCAYMILNQILNVFKVVIDAMSRTVQGADTFSCRLRPTIVQFLIWLSMRLSRQRAEADAIVQRRGSNNHNAITSNLVVVSSANSVQARRSHSDAAAGR